MEKEAEKGGYTKCAGAKAIKTNPRISVSGFGDSREQLFT